MGSAITLDVVEYLTGKGEQVSRAAGQEVTAHCMFCPDGDPKGKGKLYVNTETWLWDCKRCQATGNRKTLLAHYGDEDSVSYVAGADPAIRRTILTQAAALAHEMLLNNERQMTYLLQRGLSPQTIMDAQLGYVPQNTALTSMLPCRENVTRADLINAGLMTAGGTEFFNGSLTIPYWSHGTVIQIREKMMDGKYRTTAGGKVLLYNADSIRAADDIIITEGEYDALILAQTLAGSNNARMRQTAVVGLPGAGSWPAGIDKSFEDARHVYIGLDPDDTGKPYAQKLKALIGTKARIIELPTALPKCDWTEFLRPHDAEHPHGGHDWHDVADLIIEADLHGKRMFTMGEVRTKWGRLRTDQPGISLGFPSLDAIIRPGLKPGQLLIPLAKTGTGKSAFIHNVIHNVRSRRVLALSLELTAEEVYEHFRRIHHFYYPHADGEDFDRSYRNVRIIDQNRLRRGDLSAMIAEYREEVGASPELVTVDYLQYFARGYSGLTAYERSSEACLELKAIAKEEQVAMIVPSQVKREAKLGVPLSVDDARDSGVIEETGDFILALYRPDQADNKDGVTEVTGAFNSQLLKSRHGGNGRVFNFRFSNFSLTLVDNLNARAKARIDQENQQYRRGENYDDYRAATAQGVLVKPGDPLRIV